MSEVSKEAVFLQLKELIFEKFKDRVIMNPNEITLETMLIGDGLGFDSIAMLDIIAGLEQKFNIFINDEDLEPSVFQNMGSLANFTLNLLSKQ